MSVEEIVPAPVCAMCNKALVCRILAGFNQMMGDFAIPPVKAEDLAQICGVFWDKDEPTVIKFEADTPEPTVVLVDPGGAEGEHDGDIEETRELEEIHQALSDQAM